MDDNDIREVQDIARNDGARKESVVPSRLRINQLHQEVLKAIDKVTKECEGDLTYAEILKTLSRVSGDMVADVLEHERKQSEEDSKDDN